MNLGDDIIRLLLDELRPTDLVNFALTNRHVHSVAEKHLAEHQYLMSKYTIVCLDAWCSHEQGCGFIPEHPADLVELCVPHSRIFEYIKCVNVEDNIIGGIDALSGPSMERIKSKIMENDHLTAIYNGLSPNSYLRELDLFAYPGRIMDYFLWHVSHTVVIRKPLPQTLPDTINELAHLAKECNLQYAVPAITQWKCLRVSTCQRTLNPRDLAHPADGTMHFISEFDAEWYDVVSNILWLGLENMCEILVRSLEYLHVEFDCSPDQELIENDLYCPHWLERHDRYLRRLFEHPGSLLREVHLCGSLNRVTEHSDFPSPDRLNRPECKQSSTVNLQSNLTKTGNYFDLRVTRGCDDPLATEEAP